MVSETIFNLFAGDPIDPLYQVEKLADDVNHPYHNELLLELSSIDKHDIENILNDKNFVHWANKEDPRGLDFQAQIWWLIKYLHKEVPKRRINIFRNPHNAKRPLPFNHPALLDVKLDKNFLAPLKAFKLQGTGLIRNGFAFTMAPYIPASNVCYWLLNFFSTSKISDYIWLRLDPFIIKPAKEYLSLEYRMWVYGRPVDWDRLLTINTSEHGQWLPAVASSSDIKVTDFVWRPNKDELHFTCEELPKIEYLEERGSRYLHAIYNRQAKTISHVDGAIRLFSLDEYQKREQCHVKDTEATKIGKRIKVFEVKKNISVNDFCGITAAFYVWNQDVIDYFN